jgi:hypothetical protein
LLDIHIRIAFFSKFQAGTIVVGLTTFPAAPSASHRARVPRIFPTCTCSRHYRLSAMLSNIGEPLENQYRRRFQHCEAIIAQALSKGIRIFLRAMKSA